MKLRSLCLVLLPLLCQAQRPIINGCTQFSPSADSRIIYVSATNGDNTVAQTYAPSDPQVGADPFHPVGPIKAYQTLAAAAAQLRNGQADWILFRKGDTFVNQRFGVTTRFGKNAREPMLIGAYGNAPQRPVFLTGNQTFIDFEGASASFVAIVGLQMEPHTRSGTDSPVGIRLIGAPFRYFWVEDCYISKYVANFTAHSPTATVSPNRKHLTIRRSVIADAYTTGTEHANAMFIDNVDSILFEENLLDHNGWQTDIAGAVPTGFRHNSYFQVGCRNLIFRNNIVARASATGGGIRCGGIVYDNTFLSNPKGIQFGTFETTVAWPTQFVFGEVSYNVVLGCRPESFDPGRGITIERTKNTVVHHNIVAHFTALGGYNLGIVANEVENVTIRKNIVYKWGNNRPTGPEWSSGIYIGANLRGSNRVDSNDVQMENLKGYCMSKGGTFSNITYAANRCNNVAPLGNWFDPSGSFANWVAQSGETNAQVLDVPYSDPERSVSTYLTSLGLSGGLPEFLAKRRAMGKDNWDPAFTANAFNNYIRPGFDLPTLGTSRTDSPDSEPKIAVYPNPSADGVFQIEQGENQYQEACIFDATGKLVLRIKVTTPVFSVDLSGHPQGMYVLVLQGLSRVGAVRLVRL